ncbi:uncharacterized protein HaLaN_32693 [Haematococcus lacustris]|uniref:Uncharacterized protein n=1 Tax=Haematococcus lacustris TaxID=44745 RepID=A0A6A0AKG5_HAELA|nr:uncharacterized protein HaLaN_32693 [Haematococcus lacustris]
MVADQLDRWNLTKGQVERANGLNNARRTTHRWLAPIKPHLQHLAAANSAGTFLVANLKHITVTLATWDAVWEVYLDPMWARQRLRLYGAQDRALEQFFKKLRYVQLCPAARHGQALVAVGEQWGWMYLGVCGTPPVHACSGSSFNVWGVRVPTLVPRWGRSAINCVYVAQFVRPWLGGSMAVRAGMCAGACAACRACRTAILVPVLLGWAHDMPWCWQSGGVPSAPNSSSL